MGLLDAGAEAPQSKALRYGITGAALVIFLGVAVWFFFRYTTEKHTVEHFMDAVVAGDGQKAYQIWHPHPNFSFQDFKASGDRPAITARSRVTGLRAPKFLPRAARAL